MAKIDDKGNEVLTIKDIAMRCGVSVGTVSRVINNSGAVKASTRKRVTELIKQTGYHPSSAARNMVNKKSEIIGIIVPEISNPFLANLVGLLEQSLRVHGYSIMLCNSEYWYGNISRFIDNLISRNAEGLIIVASDISDEEQIKRIRQKLNVVLINTSFGGFDSVNVADWQASFEMVEYLISMGHKRIACMGFHEDAIPTMERFRGYSDAMKKHGLALEPQYQLRADDITGGVQNRGYSMSKKLLELPKPPTAIFAVNDYYAINAYFAVKEKGLKVGKDISIAGFDDVDICQIVNPPLTSVKCQAELMPKLASDILIDKIAHRDSVGVKSIQLTGELVKRESVQRCQDDDE